MLWCHWNTIFRTLFSLHRLLRRILERQWNLPDHVGWGTNPWGVTKWEDLSNVISAHHGNQHVLKSTWWSNHRIACFILIPLIARLEPRFDKTVEPHDEKKTKKAPAGEPAVKGSAMDSREHSPSSDDSCELVQDITFRAPVLWLQKRMSLNWSCSQ